MTLVIGGVTRCSLCERFLGDSGCVEGFTVFVWNELDPLFGFNDAAFHRSCLERDPLGKLAIERQADVRRRLGPGSHQCVVCQKAITSWSDNVAFPYLAADENELSEFNYLQFHRGCLPRWPLVASAARLHQAAIGRGQLRGTTFGHLLHELENATAR